MIIFDNLDILYPPIVILTAIYSVWIIKDVFMNIFS